MADTHELCPKCGDRFQDSNENDQTPLDRGYQEGRPNNWAEDNLKLHNDLLEQISLRLNQLQIKVTEAGVTEEKLSDLKNIMTKLQQRHGLCIDANCAPCRVQEEAIKEHVLLYVDWKVPGTVAKLEQARNRN